MKTLLTTTLLMSALAALSSGSAFTNGSFESPGNASILFLANGSTDITGWTHTGNSIANGEFYAKNNDWGINAGAGNWYIGWGGNGATGGTLFQTFDTVIGTTYTVNYLLTTQQLDGANLPLESNLVAALNGAVTLNSVTNSFNQAAGVWNAGSTLTFVAASTSTTLRFTDTTTATNSVSINWGLDAVTVTAGTPTSGVPEPGTFAMLGIGLASLAFLRKK